jgi:hypothetical protein
VLTKHIELPAKARLYTIKVRCETHCRLSVEIPNSSVILEPNAPEIETIWHQTGDNWRDEFKNTVKVQSHLTFRSNRI